MGGKIFIEDFLIDSENELVKNFELSNCKEILFLANHFLSITKVDNEKRLSINILRCRDPITLPIFVYTHGLSIRDIALAKFDCTENVGIFVRSVAS